MFQETVQKVPGSILYLHLKQKESIIVGNNGNAEKWFVITKNSVFRNDSLIDIGYFLSVKCENLLRLQVIHAEDNYGIKITVKVPDCPLCTT